MDKEKLVLLSGAEVTKKSSRNSTPKDIKPQGPGLARPGAASSNDKPRTYPGPAILSCPAPPAVPLGALQGALPWRRVVLLHYRTPGPPRPGRGADEALRRQLVPVVVLGLPSRAVMEARKMNLPRGPENLCFDKDEFMKVAGGRVCPGDERGGLQPRSGSLSPQRGSCVCVAGVDPGEGMGGMGVCVLGLRFSFHRSPFPVSFPAGF